MLARPSTRTGIIFIRNSKSELQMNPLKVMLELRLILLLLHHTYSLEVEIISGFNKGKIAKGSFLTIPLG